MSGTPAHRGAGCALSEFPPGAVVRLDTVSGGRAIRMRLASMGLIPGACLTLLQGARQGACILAVGGTRIAVGRGMARCLKVTSA
jgi:Fe2+ transport system protein FeoA